MSDAEGDLYWEPPPTSEEARLMAEVRRVTVERDEACARADKAEADLAAIRAEIDTLKVFVAGKASTATKRQGLPEDPEECSFCGKPRREVALLVCAENKPGARICNECLSLALNQVAAAMVKSDGVPAVGGEKGGATASVPTPAPIPDSDSSPLSRKKQ